MVMFSEMMEADVEECCWSAACAEVMEQEAFWATPKVKQNDIKKTNKKIQQKVDQYSMDVAAAKIVRGKARLEYPVVAIG